MFDAEIKIARGFGLEVSITIRRLPFGQGGGAKPFAISCAECRPASIGGKGRIAAKGRVPAIIIINIMSHARRQRQASQWAQDHLAKAAPHLVARNIGRAPLK